MKVNAALTLLLAFAFYLRKGGHKIYITISRSYSLPKPSFAVSTILLSHNLKPIWAFWHFSCSKPAKTESHGLTRGFLARRIKVRMNKMKKSDGFTLLELLVTIVIFGIIASIAIPGFSRWLPNYRLKGVARDIYSNLQFAKMGAVKERGEWAVVFDRANNRYQVVSGGADRDYSTSADNVVQRTVNLTDYGSGISYGHGSATTGVSGGGFGNDITFSGDTVVFNSRGMINSATGGYVYVQNNRNNTMAVGAWTTGVIVMRKWRNNNWEQ